MKYSKIITVFLVFTMLSMILPNPNHIKAAQLELVEENVEIDETEVELLESLGIVVSDELEYSVQETADENISVDINLNTEDLQVNSEVQMDIDSEDLFFSTEIVDDNGDVTYNEYQVTVHEAIDDVFIATVTDSTTGEIHEINTTELSASALPLIIMVIINVGARFALKQFAKKAITDAVRKLAFGSKSLLDSHYKKHVVTQKEFGNITKAQYLRKAQDLIGSESKNVLSKKRSNGDRVFYDKSKNEFAVLSKDGIIRTFFKPKDGIKYYNRQ
ncbi:SAR2788 family putative toxin [Bacillus suaedae]|uniref:SAR2788 family putative toxin n=1 Tax=Halalkalibacter suaedae TaxID=2822140 RepID=A0A940WR76_9BACI|nr:SAR2788 family putative toxin [Bacillus suaedae]MBP3950318.1 SAR2788 family putative toxin [Bacillus suaedae]